MTCPRKSEGNENRKCQAECLKELKGQQGARENRRCGRQIRIRQTDKCGRGWEKTQKQKHVFLSAFSLENKHKEAKQSLSPN